MGVGTAVAVGGTGVLVGVAVGTKVGIAVGAFVGVGVGALIVYEPLCILERISELEAYDLTEPFDKVIVPLPAVLGVTDSV